MLQTLADRFSLPFSIVKNTLNLLDEGATIPFVARYRKEVTGGMDDQLLRKLSDAYDDMKALEERRKDVLRLIGEMDALTPEIEKTIQAAQTLTALEDIYRPFRPKRKTRASVAKAKGLTVLAALLKKENVKDDEFFSLADSFVSEEKEIPNREAAISGAMDIVAEELSDSAKLREKIRAIFFRTGILQVQRKKEEPSVYEMYYQYTESISRIAGHRVLAINRGEQEEFLSVQSEMDNELAETHILLMLPAGAGEVQKYRQKTAKDAWKRLLHPSLSTEIRKMLTEKAQEEALLVFSKNLKDLLMVPPMKNHTVLSIDPAFRTGCKLAVLDRTGKPLYTGVIYPTPPENKIQEAKEEILRLYKKFSFTLAAIGNGTASRETEKFVAETIREHHLQLRYYIVNEAGASVYSASPLAAKEFPDLDLTRRSAISIGRRVQDPLAELVKIEPKAIGVGQYQHDMNEKKLEHILGGVVEACVNDVGVDLNTASGALLSYIAGVSKPVAENIVRFREENGSFSSRAQVKKVPRMGPKIFEQCAGFLRVAGGDEPLDNTRVHPESYDIARRLQTLEKPYDLETLSLTWGVGVMTLQDIEAALSHPGYDPREELAQPELRSDVMEMTDLKEGMLLSGVVRNVSAFGAFVDIGVHQDGLVHISELSNQYVKNPMDVVRIGQQVRVKIIGLDVEKKRISLSMKQVD